MADKWWWLVLLPWMAPVLSLSLLPNYQFFSRFHVSSVIFSLPLQRPWVVPKESRCWGKGSSWAERAWNERIGRGFAGESGATLFPLSCIRILDSHSWYLRLNPCYMVANREELGLKDDRKAPGEFHCGFPNRGLQKSWGDSVMGCQDNLCQE